MDPDAEQQAPIDQHELPAPYRNPWLLLGRDVRAVLASLRLKRQELWRLNGDGDLWVPSRWPRRLRPWFWPLLVALLLGAVLLVARWLSLPGPPVDRAPIPLTPAAAPAPQQEFSGAPPADPAMGQYPALNPDPALSQEPALSAATAAVEPTPLQIDPLLALLAEQDPAGLIIAARPQGGRSLLELTLADGFGSQAAVQREQQAGAWLERAHALGYEKLELVDGRGRLLGRSALVGGGMIVLEPPETV
ncbi:hypothetical protein KQ313_06145 [Synechococcus sp. CS-1325]|uniref:hypothetical protein n=1 Tax=Synechococcus sp. CS-1325 TaxID=2847979 RepID=UPI000DB0242C|nr:hypothetical protein [Synechococcus sp. CS-1325]MCT0199255.1 hypothetical protein [Synechococcus sp. CS-1325]PZV00105.1 MAG: hypothetical protein DCF24_08085 [Cyanobium sp.]